MDVLLSPEGFITHHSNIDEVAMDDRKEALKKVSDQRWRVAVTLSVCMLVIYFGFILLIAFDKPLMGTILTPGLSLGILLGVIVILSAWVLTTIYVRWANRVYDEKIAKLRR
jgi:uncharacterized membrane protein (DUF485 family)